MTRPTHSKALAYSGKIGQLDLMELAIPQLEQDEALVRVASCTLCGSDLHSLHGRRRVPTPTILGHEIVGDIIEMGDQFPRFDIQSKELHLGDRVTWAIVANCGNCYYCLRGLEQKCESACKYGHMGFDSGYVLSGGLAEYCVLASGTKVVKLPDCAPLEIFTPASCSTATVMAAMSDLTAPSVHGGQIAIIGAGMLGLTACAVAKQTGWNQVIVVDPIPARRHMATKFGATHRYAPDVWLETTKLKETGGYDVVLELSGDQSMMIPAVESLRMGGHVILVGAVFPVPPISLLPEMLIRRQITLRGIHNYRPKHLSEAVEFLTQHGQIFPFNELVSQWYDLSEVDSLIRDDRAANQVRIGVRLY